MNPWATSKLESVQVAVRFARAPVFTYPITLLAFRMYFISYRIVAAFFLMLCSVAAVSGETVYCSPSSELTKYEGEYARKDIWEKLKTAKDWASMDEVISRTGQIIAITIPTSGDFSGAVNHWHEGASPCIKFNKHQLWATDTTGKSPDGSAQDAVWVGPFIRVGPAYSETRLYFNQLFGNKCFESSRGDRWCFGSGYIEVDYTTYHAELVLDLAEMPNYGFSVLVKPTGEKEKLWVFVRDGDGWQLFDEKRNNEERWADKRIRNPWLILKTRVK